MASLLNRFISLCKWPLAVILLLLFPTLLQQLWAVIQHIATHVQHYQWLLVGAGLYGVLWFLGLRHSTMMRWFSTLEHELTHALVAILTLNRVTGLNATHNGGVMQFQGFGNWLITLAPYFIPTLSLVVLGLMNLAKATYYPMLFAVMGFSMAYHLQSTWHELHDQQPDLKQAGWLFCWLFLPAANVVMALVLLTALPNDTLTWAKTQSSLWDALSHWQAVLLSKRL